MRSIVLFFVFVWAVSANVTNANTQSDPLESGDSTESSVPVAAAENNNIDDADSMPSLPLPPLSAGDEPSLPTPVEFENNNNGNITTEVNDNSNNNIDNDATILPDAAPNENSTNDPNIETNNSQDDIGSSQSWNKWDKQFAPRNNDINAPVPQGSLPPPPPYNGNVNNYHNSNPNANANIESPDNKPIPYLMWHRDPWTHRFNLAPYAPGYAAAPQELLIPPSKFSLWLTSFPSHGYYWQQPQYLGYYDPMPEIVSATPSRAQMILGYPNTPQTQYRDPYTGQPLNDNPAINPESILPVRETLIDRWRRRSFERRSVPLGQFPGQPQLANPNYPQQIQSPLFGQPYQSYQPYQPYNPNNQQENSYANPNEQLQPNQSLPQQPRYVRRPLGRIRQGLRDRIQRLGIFEALTQGRSNYNNQNNQSQNAQYDEAPTYDGTN
jgi:hypothetical protein